MFKGIVEFINKTLNIKEELNRYKLKNSVNSTHFNKLKSDEKKNGFVEAVPSKKMRKKFLFLIWVLIMTGEKFWIKINNQI